MEDFGDYIYLIVIAIAALSSFFKKKKPAQAATLPPVDEVDDLDQELQEFFEEKKVVPEPIVVSKKMTAAPQRPMRKVFETMNDSMESRIKKSPKSKTITEVPEVYEPAMVLELETVEQARKAFVYSEIFNRKY